ncbi:hypothetical protein HanXRQr2_Chr17g0795241 [Helianthus annuus]|uniref:Uncharacterized protein n=1 Tax=Helianthus annuus TaxID=4232 RepID=A0A9K3DIA3_HELAN|nr:uncharacterized protein LOC110919722 isoform X1 [Helianthus annuus]KAF5754793.1 hypothetical protein HanXRQr2_Chr17g0795241 [Helianthus annuus]
MGLLETLHCHMEVMQRLPQKSRPLAKKNVRSICFFAKFRAISDQLYRSPHLSITNMSERRDEGCWSWNLLELDARFSERLLFITFLSFCKTVTFCPVISIITPTSFINGKGENTRKFNTTKKMSQD